MYRASEEVATEQGTEFRNNMPPFRPFVPTDIEKNHIKESFLNMLQTQNGEGIDECAVDDGNKVERYLQRYERPSDLLLLGVGVGREIKVAQDMGFRTQGTTLGSRNIDFGKKYLSLSPANHLEAMNEALPFQPGSFDVVAGFQVFEHAIAPLLFLLEIGRVLRPGGKCFLEWPVGEAHTDGANPHHQICYEPGQAHALFQKAGFTDIKLYYHNLQEIPREKWWTSEGHSMYPCIEGTKSNSEARHLQNWWKRSFGG